MSYQITAMPAYTDHAAALTEVRQSHVQYKKELCECAILPRSLHMLRSDYNQKPRGVTSCEDNLQLLLMRTLSAWLKDFARDERIVDSPQGIDVGCNGTSADGEWISCRLLRNCHKSCKENRGNL
jgi:hypothetical protein